MSSTQAKKNGRATSDVSVQDLSEQIQILKDDISALTSSLGDFTVDTGKQAAATAQAKAEDAAEMGRKKAIETQQKAEDFITTQPATALGLAAGIGFLVGMMTARR